MIMIAPAGFKESIGAPEVADAIEAGLAQVWPDVEMVKVPIPDGGEGFTTSMVSATDGDLEYVDVAGPVGQPVRAPIGFLGGGCTRTAVIEMAAAAGLRLVPHEDRNPLLTSTFGVGQLISAVLDRGAERILIGCGDSGTSDAGAGMLGALGARLLDGDGVEIGPGAAGLTSLRTIDLAGLDPRLARVDLEAACNVTNVLCGDNGVARVYGPQKGADAEALDLMDAGLNQFASVAQRHVGPDADGRTPDLATMPGGGASGGMGAALAAFLHCKLISRFDIVFDYVPFAEALERASLVITAEGAIDFQTPRGKVPAEVARRARDRGVPCISIAGTLGKDYLRVHDAGIDAVFSILDRPRTTESAIANTDTLLRSGAIQIARLIDVAQSISVPRRAPLGTAMNLVPTANRHHDADPRPRRERLHGECAPGGLYARSVRG